MTQRSAERVLEISYTMGSGPIVLFRPVTGYRRLVDVGCVDGDTVDLVIEAVSSNGTPTGDWEMGTYTWGTGNVLTRTTITASSNGGAAVNWANGTRWIKARSSGSSVEGGGSTGIALMARAGTTVAGDSHNALGDGIAAGGTVAGPTSQSIMQWAFALGRRGPVFIQNRAVSGSTIDDVIALVPNIMSDSTDIVHLHTGVNNLNPTIDTTTPTVAVIGERMRRLLDMLSLKPLVILDAIMPLDVASISGALPRRTDIPLINAIYKQLAALYPNVIYNDLYTPLAQDAASGLALPGMTGSDGIHLPTKTVALCGKITWATILAAKIAMRSLHRSVTSFALPPFSGAGGTKTASTGTINGAVADNCEVQIATNATGVVVTATVAAARANSQRVRIQNGNAAATVVRLQLTALTAYLTGLASGDPIRAGGFLDVVSQVGLLRHDLSAMQNPSGTPVVFASLQKSAFETTPILPDAPYTIRPFAIAALTATPASMNILWTFEVAAGGDVTLDVYGWTFEEVVSF